MSDAVVQPNDIRAEEELLGAALTIDGTIGSVQAEIGLRPEDFYLGGSAVIFAAMLELARDGKPVTEVTVANVLERDPKRLEEAGGRDRLQVLSLPTNPAHALHYAEIVRDKARWRRRFTAGLMIREAAATEDADQFAAAEAQLTDDPSRDRALYDGERQKDLIFDLIEGKAKAEFFWPIDKLNRLQGGGQRHAAGMRRGQLIVLSGYTNEGKSHFAGQLLDTNHKHGRVCLYDNEMDPAEQAARRAARVAGIPYGPLMNGTLDRDQRHKAMRFLNDEDLHWPIVDTSGWTVEEVCLHIRQYRWDFVVIDILHNFPFADERELSAAVARLKAAARLANCCIVLVAHVNRVGIERGRRRRPVRSDLRWSGDIENLADVVCFVYRKQDEETLEPTNEGFVYFDKVRGGTLGGAGVAFDSDRLRFTAHFESREPEHQQDTPPELLAEEGPAW